MTRTGWIVLAVAVAGAAGFGALLVNAERNPEGPVPVAWDRETCAHCKMHVGDPKFATQVQLDDGRVLVFDDPGCMFGWLGEHNEPRHAIWLHHVREDAWLPEAEAAFEPGMSTPMGFGLGVVRAGEPGALSWADARRAVAGHKGGH